jgi:hypothetical protein
MDKEGGKELFYKIKDMIATHHTFLATSCLLVHIIIRGTSARALRSFSVTEDFEPGGQPHHFAQMDPGTRAAIEQTWREIENADRSDFDPAHAVFSLAKTRKLVGANGWENVRHVSCNS